MKRTRLVVLFLLTLVGVLYAQTITTDRLKVRCTTIPSAQPGIFLLACDDGDDSLHLIGPGTGPSILEFTPGALADLGSPPDGSLGVCNNCAAGSNPCTVGSATIFAQREAGQWNCATAGPGGVTSINFTAPGGIFSVAGVPITGSGTIALSVAGTSGGIPYFSNGSTLSSSAALTANAILKGGGAGVAPSVSAATDNGTTIALGARDLSYAQALYIGPARQISTSVSAGATDRDVECTSGSSTDKTYTLPTATGSGRTIDFSKVDTGTKSCIAAVPSGALNTGTIDTLTTAWQGITCKDRAAGQWHCRGSGTVS